MPAVEPGILPGGKGARSPGSIGILVSRFLVLSGDPASNHCFRKKFDKNRATLGVEIDCQRSGLERRVAGTKKARLGYRELEEATVDRLE